MPHNLQYLLLQVRNPDDPMRAHEISSFARVLQVPEKQIQIFDLLSRQLSPVDHITADMFLIGGSGHYSAAGEGKWLNRALDSLREVYDSKKPTFASCWGFQAMARAMGGKVIHNLEQAEIGTHHLHLTSAGLDDPLFSPLGETFLAQMGHEDMVLELPPNAVLLASSNRVINQAYKFVDRPIYCTQFHPELNCDDLLQRVQIYPEYIEKIANMPADRFSELLKKTPQTEQLLRRFVEMVVEG